MSKLSLLLSKLIPQSLERMIRTFRDSNLRSYNTIVLPGDIYKTDHFYSISLCTTCMNRLFHLKHTIEQNIRDNISYPNIEFVLIDYNSQDGVEEYVYKNLKKYIDRGLLNYYKTPSPERFHASKAKNLSHALAKGEIVCNVDGDNFTGKDFAFYLNYLNNRDRPGTMYQFHKPPFWGTVGRLAFRKTDFMNLGGYDESLLTIGHEDMDLVNRGRAFGLELKRIEIENFQRYLSNTTLEKAINCTGRADYYQLEQTNKLISDENIKKNILRANTNGMENFEIYKNFDSLKLESADLIRNLRQTKVS